MVISQTPLVPEIEYPESDGKPMSESDQTRRYLVYGTEALAIHFQNRPDVYVSGNLFIYYEEGNPQAVVSPDVFVVLGVAAQLRRSYKTWEEGGKSPDFVLEITSKSTKKEDQKDKPKLYAKLGVKEYFQYDPTGDYLKNPSLLGQRLINGKYEPITPINLPSGVLSIVSEVLGLELRLMGKNLRFYNPMTEQILLTYEETEQARLQAEQAQRDAIPRLLALGLNVEQIGGALGLSIQQVEQVIDGLGRG